MVTLRMINSMAWVHLFANKVKPIKEVGRMESEMDKENRFYKMGQLTLDNSKMVRNLVKQL